MQRFQETFCSQCGGAFGPGDSGFSHCVDHAPDRLEPNSNMGQSERDLILDQIRADQDDVECPACRGHGEIASPEKKHWSPCRLCNGTGAVPEQVSRDWPATP